MVTLTIRERCLVGLKCCHLCEVSSAVNTLLSYIPLKDDCLLDNIKIVLNELVGNCFKHGNSNKVELRAEIDSAGNGMNLLVSSECIGENKELIRQVFAKIQQGEKCKFISDEHGLGTRLAYAFSDKVLVLGNCITLQVNPAPNDERMKAVKCI